MTGISKASKAEFKFDPTLFPIGKMGEIYLKFQQEYDAIPIIEIFVESKDSSIPHSEYPCFTYDDLTTTGVRIRHTSIDLEKFNFHIRVFGHLPECIEIYKNFELAILFGHYRGGF